MDDENENLDQQQQTNPANEAAKQAASKAAKDFAKKSVKSAASNAIRSFLIPLMPWILGIAIALIVTLQRYDKYFNRQNKTANILSH